MPSLVASNGQSVDLPFKQVTIGSDPQCDIPMRADLGIAFKHVVLNVTPQGTWLQSTDLNQPVMVNGTRLISAALQDGDVLTLGMVSLTFRAPPQAPVFTPAPAPEVTPHPMPTGYARVPVPRAPTEARQVAQAAAHPVVRVYGIPVTVTPLSTIITGILGICLGLAMIVFMYLTGGRPLQKTDLMEVSKELASSQWVRVPRGSSYTLLTSTDNEVFSLPPDVRIDLGTMRPPVVATIGVVKTAYEKHPGRTDIVTLSVNGQPRRTLARHNELKARMNNVMMFVGPALALGCLWMVFTGFEKRAEEKRNRLG